jgi:hypothetical protein
MGLEIENKIGSNPGGDNTQIGVLIAGKEEIKEFLSKYLEKVLAPSLKTDIELLKDAFLKTFEEIVTQNYINRLKKEIGIENIKYHIEEIEERIINLEHFSVQPKSKAESVKRFEMVNDWLKGIENVSAEEEELSKIWEGWFLEFDKDSKLSEHKYALEKMKELSAEEAKMLLKIHKSGWIRTRKLYYHSFKEISSRRINSKAQFEINTLIKKSLIEKKSIWNFSFLIVVFISICSFVVSIFFFTASMPLTDLDKSFIGVGTLMLTIVLGFLILETVNKPKYILTWIGERIVSYAEKDHREK